MTQTGADGRPVILTLLGVLWPGSDSSGPNQSFRAMAAALRDEFDFRVIARDRAHGRRDASVECGRWFDCGDYRALYCEAGRVHLRGLMAALRATPHDLLALNGFFDREMTIPVLLARRAGLLARTPLVLSPRGEFSDGALALGAGRKRVWMRFVRALGLTRTITYHAASQGERADILAKAPEAKACTFAPNIRPLLAPIEAATTNRDGLRIVFIGRLSPVKGLDLALAALARVRAPVTFDVYGPKEDGAHWSRCETLIAALPPHVVARWCGEIANADVPAALAGAALFLMPSRSENFGHAIFEALSCAVPVMIGHATPWNDLRPESAGFNVTLEPSALATAIDAFAALSPDARARFSAGARARAERFVREGDAVGLTRAMFRTTLSEAGGTIRPAASEVLSG